MSAVALPRLHVLLAVDMFDQSTLRSASAATAAIATAHGIDFVATLLGRSAQSAVRDVIRDGAGRVLLATHAQLDEHSQTVQIAAAFAEAIEWQGIGQAGLEGTLWLLPAGPFGAEIAGHLAVRFAGAALGQCSDGIELSAAGVQVSRAGFGGRATVRLHSESGPWFATLRGPRMQESPADAGSDRTDVEVISFELNVPLPEAIAISRKEGKARAVDPAHCDVVVSGGRGIGGDEGIALLDRLATWLGGTWAGSLPAVDAGWVPVSRQVGQSGCYVSPALYVAVGISGTPQHMAGISPDTRIVAINSDPEADIFRYAEIGVVADWKEVLPLLLERLHQHEVADVAQP